VEETEDATPKEVEKPMSAELEKLKAKEVEVADLTVCTLA
jgi:hypothetical protein